MKEIVRASIEDCSQIERFRLVTRLGNAILSNGGEVFRAEQAMEYAARALRLEAFNAYVIANGIFSNVVIDGRFYSSRICYVPLAPTILCRVDALNDLSRKIAAGKCGPYEMRMRLEQIEQMKVLENRERFWRQELEALDFVTCSRAACAIRRRHLWRECCCICSFYTQLRAFLRPG